MGLYDYSSSEILKNGEKATKQKVEEKFDLQ